jgi:hypothetical protein
MCEQNRLEKSVGQNTETDGEPSRNGLTPKESFSLVVDLIKHEDSLVNLRTNWTLAFQALLFTAFATLLGLFEKFHFSNPNVTPIHIGLFMLCVLGVASSLAGFLGVRAAEQQQIWLNEWWVRQRPKSNDDLFPPLYPHSANKGRRRASEYFIVLACLWVGIVMTIIFSKALVPRVSIPATQSGLSNAATFNIH